MLLYLIRHAESENNAKEEHLREEDPPLSPLGESQADCLAGWVEQLEFDQLVTSPFLRTLQTTRKITDRTDRPVQVWHNVFERGGCFRGHGSDAKEGAPGLGRSDIERLVCAAPERCTIDQSIGEQGWWHGRRRETDEEAAGRAAEVNARLLDTFGGSGQTIVAVIHADLKRLLLAEMLHPAVDLDRLGPLWNTGITRLNFQRGTWELDWFNSLSHLPGSLLGRGEGYAVS